jgi:hypothetical protein
VAAEFGPSWTPARVAEVRESYAELTRGELKLMSKASERFTPSAGQIAAALGMTALGFALTRILSRS